MSYPASLSPSKGPGYLAPSRIRVKRREPSGVFSLFQNDQIKQFKEAFSLIDQDGDGIVSESDLKSIFGSLGITPTRQTMQALVDARPAHDGPISLAAPDDSRGVNFTMFLTMMGEHLLQLDSQDEIRDAFACFDENDEGKVRCDEMRKWLGEVGDRMDPQEIDRLLKGPFTDRQGYFNYREWIKVLRVNQEDEPAA